VVRTITVVCTLENVRWFRRGLSLGSHYQVSSAKALVFVGRIVRCDDRSEAPLYLVWRKGIAKPRKTNGSRPKSWWKFESKKIRRFPILKPDKLFSLRLLERTSADDVRGRRGASLHVAGEAASIVARGSFRARMRTNRRTDYARVMVY